jgi:O-antigen ligase
VISAKSDYRGAAFGAFAALAALAVSAESKVSVLAASLVPLVLIASLWILAGPERWIAVFFGAVVLLPPLPLAFGNSGPHPALCIALIGLMAGLAYSREWRLRLTPLNLAILFLTTVILCSVGLAAIYSGGGIAIDSLARAILFSIAVYVFYYTACGPGGKWPLVHFRQVRLLFGFAVVAGFFACIDFYYQFPAPGGFSPQFVWLESGVFRRAQGLFYEASTLGNFCAFFLTMIAVSIFRPTSQRPVALPFMIGGGAILAATVVLSYSRASVVNLMVSFAALWMLQRKMQQRKRGSIWRPLLVLVCSGAVAGLICYALVPDLVRAYGFRLQNSVLYSLSSTNGVLSGRLDVWRTILHFLAEHPWHLVLGVGYKTLPYSSYVGTPVIADNAFLSALAETGLVGLGALLFFLFTVLRAGYFAARDSDPRRSFFGAWTFCFWCGQTAQMFSGDLLTYWRVLPIYFWVLALAVR